MLKFDSINGFPFAEFIYPNNPKGMLKKITVKNVHEFTITRDAAKDLQDLSLEGFDSMEASDGYHTFGELYEHRIGLFIALAKLSARQEHAVAAHPDTPFVWRSKLHSDGSSFDGWFILGVGFFEGQQMTYHLPLSKWEETEFATTLEKAPEFDGHTSADVLERLKSI